MSGTARYAVEALERRLLLAPRPGRFTGGDKDDDQGGGAGVLLRR